MPGMLTDQIVLVTGGGSGIGRASAIACARVGAKVVVADVDSQGGEQTVRTIKDAGGEGVFVKADVSRATEVEALINRVIELYDRLDCAHNNVGGAKDTRIYTHEYSEEDWGWVVDINLKSAWLCMKYEIPHMLEQGGGVIVNTSSVLGLGGVRGSSAYVAGKHGVIGLTRAAALEYAQQGIRINAVCPGYIPTPAVKRIMDTDPGLEAQFIASEPIGRMGRPEEIAEAVVWLCSDAASFVTGHAMAVDGGYLAQ